ncbi:MAG: hypothetical protein AB7G28_03270 [Pirellulales bacterium]
MHIPSHWTRGTATIRLPDGREFPLTVWGWANDKAAAQRIAAERLQRVQDRFRSGDWPDWYAYGSRPLREEILQTFHADGAAEPVAIVTRNGYGTQVLNTSSLLFLDIDRPLPTLRQRLPRWLGGKPAPTGEEILFRLRRALEAHAPTTFRIYQTAWGWRVAAVDREFNPTSDSTQSLMRATDTDPYYMRLCQVQQSFRARLTPKPWRCHVAPPTSQYPRTDEQAQRQFAAWLRDYEQKTTGHATCRYLETVGTSKPNSTLASLLELHDTVTRSHEPLPLA